MSAAAPKSSALYLGTLRHRRRGPHRREFRYPLFLAYLDLDELPRLFERRWLWSYRRPNVVFFRRRDYLGDAERPLAEEVRRLVEQRSGVRPEGPIRLLTHLRTFGFQMNPASFYYCFDPEGRALEHLVVEITNTPWGERYCYVLSEPEAHGRERIHTASCSKVFHVSPFLPLEQEYRWRYSLPGERLFLHVENLEGERSVFDATLDLQRRPLEGKAMARVLAGFPWMTAKVAFWIYWQALQLWLTRTPFFPHPKLRSGAETPPGPEPLGGFEHERIDR